MPIDEIEFAVSCSATGTDKFELQLTSTGDKARNWMTVFIDESIYGGKHPNPQQIATKGFSTVFGSIRCQE